MRTGIYTVALSLLSSVFATASPIGDYKILTTNGKITGHPTPNVSNIAEFLWDPFISHHRYPLIVMNRLSL